MKHKKISVTVAILSALFCTGSTFSQILYSVVVDSPASISVPAKTLSFDSTSGALAIVYTRQSAPLSGIVYAVSTNLGSTWTRMPHNILPGTARYPTGTIFNPIQSSDPTDALFSYCSPALNPFSFGDIVYGVNQFFSPGGVPFYVQETGNFWSAASIWAAGGWCFWATRRGSGNNDFVIWRTQDYTVVFRGAPWFPSAWAQLGLSLGGTYRNGTSYFSTWAIFPGEPGVVFNLRYSKSANNGASWSGWIGPSPDWRSVPGIAGSIYDDWWDYGGPGNYSFDFVVDVDNKVHFFGIIEDAVTRARALVEIYETGSGWNSRFVTTNLRVSTNLPAGHQINAAINPAGNVLAVEWLDAPNAGDSLADVWVSLRSINGDWWLPRNITQTSSYAEQNVTMAPTLLATGNSVDLFLAESRPVTSSLRKLVFHRVNFTGLPVLPEIEEQHPGWFGLEQNYPNPFNPSTVIRYRLPVTSFVTLKMYSMLGQEVATLVNEEKKPGSYEVPWDAVGLPSGVYLCQLQSEGRGETRKIVLLK